MFKKIIKNTNIYKFFCQICESESRSFNGTLKLNFSIMNPIVKESQLKELNNYSVYPKASGNHFCEDKNLLNIKCFSFPTKS